MLRATSRLILLDAVLAAIATGRCGAQSRPIEFCPAPAKGEKPRYTIRILAPQSAVRAGSGLRLKYVVKNIADCTILAPSLSWGGFVDREIKLDVRDKRGDLLHPASVDWRIEDLPVGSQRAASLGAGETAEGVMDVSKMYPLNKPGKFRVQVRYLWKPSGKWVKSNQVTVIVTE